jgi:ribonuclease J
VIPDISYLSDKLDKIRGIVFTHGHDDHIGGISYLFNRLGKPRMWATPLTAAFANIKLTEAKITARVEPVRDSNRVLRLGVFTVEFIHMTHSIPDAANLAITTPVGIFYHGSDFKFDFTPLDGIPSEIAKINAVGRRGVLCMLTDCLGSERRGFTPSERVVGDTIQKELDMCEGKFIFTTQSSNISRIQLALELGIKAGRQIAFFGRSIDQNVEAAFKLGYMKYGREHQVRDRDLKKIPRNKQFLIVAGSQGQTESALTRIANDNHKFVTLEEGDTVVVSADPIPGNENSVNALIEQLYRQGARVSYSDIMEDLHVSGHGSQADLMLMLAAIGPKYIIPIGGTYRHAMQYRRLVTEIGWRKNAVLLPDDGVVLEFNRQTVRQMETLELENIMIDGLGIGDVGNVVLRDRKTIATEGIVVVVVPIDKQTGRVTSGPDIISRGFVYMKESGELVDKAKKIVLDNLKLKKGRIMDWQFVRKNIEENLALFLDKSTGRNPLIVPVIIEV